MSETLREERVRAKRAYSYADGELYYELWDGSDDEILDALILGGESGPTVLVTNLADCARRAYEAHGDAIRHWDGGANNWDGELLDTKEEYAAVARAVLEAAGMLIAESIGSLTLLPGDDPIAVLIPPGAPHKAGTAPVIEEGALIAIIKRRKDEDDG